MQKEGGKSQASWYGPVITKTAARGRWRQEGQEGVRDHSQLHSKASLCYLGRGGGGGCTDG